MGRRSNTMKVLGWLVGIAAVFACILIAVSCLLLVAVVDQVRDRVSHGGNSCVTNPAELGNSAEDDSFEGHNDVDTPGKSAFGTRGACTTPNGEVATCEVWYRCRTILVSLASDIVFARTFAEESSEECGESSLVCCGHLGHYLKTFEPPSKYPPQVPTPPDRTNVPKRPEAPRTPKTYMTLEEKRKLLPSAKVCGYQHTDDYDYDRNETSLDEFPWMAYIPFAESNRMTARCSGFLISRRYVITTQFCGYGLDPITKIYLGRYNRHEDVSCVRNDKLGFDECTETSSGIKVTQQSIPDDGSVYANDIRLLRLERDINYSDYVRPICLPLNETTRAKAGDEVITSGWGARNYNESALVKKRVKYTLQGLKEKNNGTFQMYATPKVANETAYLGDDGGPLMFKYKHQWFAEGIVHLDDLPYRDPSRNFNAKAAKISALTIEWILNTIEP